MFCRDCTNRLRGRNPQRRVGVERYVTGRTISIFHEFEGVNVPAVDVCHETAPEAPSRWRARTTRALLTVAGATGAWIILGSTAASAADAPADHGILDGLTATVKTVTAPVNTVVTKAVAAKAVAPVAAATAAPVTAVVTQVVTPVVQPVAQVVAPVVAPVTQAAAPVVKDVVAVVAPAVKATANAVAPAVKPVIDAVQPVLDSVQPVLDAAQSIVDAVRPVIDSLDPVIDAIGPVIDSLDPVVDTLDPVVDLPVEIDVPDIDSAALSSSPQANVDTRGEASQQAMRTSASTHFATADRAITTAPIASTQTVGPTPAPSPLERTPATESPASSTTTSTQSSAPSGVLEYAGTEHLTAIKVVVRHSSSLVAGPALAPGNSPD